MKPVPNTLLFILLLALCGLCAWQWQRESDLRALASQLRDEAAMLQGERAELTERVKAADAEILRLTTTLTELRANSVSKEEHGEVTAANAQMREAVEKQNTAIKDQNDALLKLNGSLKQANDIIQKVTAERDAIVKRLNDVTRLLNEKKP